MCAYITVISCSAGNIILNFMEVEMVRKLDHIVELLVALLTGKSVSRKIVVVI